MPEPPDRGQVVGVRVCLVDRQRPLHDRRHRRQEADAMVGDQPEKPLGVEAAHQHQVMAHQQCDGRGGEAGVVRQRHRYQRGVALLGAQWIADRRRDPAVAAGLDQLGPPGAAAGSHRFPHRRDRLWQWGVRQRGIRFETGWHTGELGVLSAGQQGWRSQLEQTRQLRVGQPRRKRLRHRAQLPARHRGLDPFDRVGQHHRHVIADAHAALGIGASQPVRRAVELGAGQGHPVAGDRRLVGSEFGQRRNLRTDRRDRLTHTRPGARRCGADSRPTWCATARR